MRLNYGKQEVYRRAGTEPRCASCRHFGAAPAPAGEQPGKRWCPQKDWYTAPDGICTAYEREPGAD